VISSSSSVPPWACSNLPACEACAPVKAPRRAVVVEARQHFLAGARFAVDQHGAVGCRDPCCQRVQRARDGVDDDRFARELWKFFLVGHARNKSKFHAGQSMPIT
jgi:hypothetical protein